MAAVVAAAKRGFTLIELLVVIAVIGALMGMLLPVVARARGTAHKTFCSNNLKQIGVGFATYLNAHDDFYPCAPDPISAKPFYWLWMGRGWRGFVAPFFGQKIGPQNPLRAVLQGRRAGGEPIRVHQLRLLDGLRPQRGAD